MFENVSFSEHINVLKFRINGKAPPKNNSWRALERGDNVLGGDSESFLCVTESVHHWLVNYVDTKAKCCHLKKWPGKGLCVRGLSEPDLEPTPPQTKT